MLVNSTAPQFLLQSCTPWPCLVTVRQGLGMPQACAAGSDPSPQWPRADAVRPILSGCASGPQCPVFRKKTALFSMRLRWRVETQVGWHPSLFSLKVDIRQFFIRIFTFWYDRFGMGCVSFLVWQVCLSSFSLFDKSVCFLILLA